MDRSSGPQQDQESAVNEANTYRNQVLPRAKGEAESIIQRAEAYKAQIVARASGDAQRFTQVYDQYAKAKDITTERLYLDTMEEVLRNVNKVLIDSKDGKSVLPYLPLSGLKPNPDAIKSGGGATTSTSSTTSQGSK